jgi:hypothetical protein
MGDLTQYQAVEHVNPACGDASRPGGGAWLRWWVAMASRAAGSPRAGPVPAPVGTSSSSAMAGEPGGRGGSGGRE